MPLAAQKTAAKVGKMHRIKPKTKKKGAPRSEK